ncbi:hypothetical protein PpBr36_00380 [Pyricularia pennisetigena]|uniref:hypothetical protein n=1 Tax=Pyricularia pennisetigena TaxID=1578925 RepID=UPI00115307EA|nr:hypothetical protein PpBr36_00380 [Pyricularia pennisetigena]TLS28560.1 hypothetical protein PpBr36_00380 [Pyricularia pennisetigena]
MPMPTIRNPFARKQHNDENQRPQLETTTAQQPQQPGGFDKVDTVGSKSSSIAGLSINSGRSNDTGEYKLSGMISTQSQPNAIVCPFSLHDISARSPITKHDAPARQSLDSSRFPRPRLSMNERRPEPTTVEEPFEDVGLGDDRQPKGVQQMQQQQLPQPQKKRGFFSKFGSSEPQTDGILLKAQD